jgi:D-xylose transport system substrate-binding protein
MQRRHLLAAGLGAPLLGLPALARAQRGISVGVSWSNFQEERWKTDEAAIQAALRAAGATYLSADAQSSPAKQLTDIESLLSRGVKALIVLAQDAQAIRPAVQRAVDEGVAVVGYDRLIENPNAFYLTFDNVEVGRLMARAVPRREAGGQLRLHQGQLGRPERELPVPGLDRGAEARHRCRPHPQCGRGLHGWLAARQCAAEHGAVPDPQQQPHRCGHRGE